MSETSTAMSMKNKDYANDKGLIAVTNAVKRRNLDATITKDEKSTYYIVDYKAKNNPMVSIIICTRRNIKTLG